MNCADEIAINLGSMKSAVDELTSSPKSGAHCLILIDVQVGFREETYWGVPANPGALNKISLLVDWAKLNRTPIVLVRHDSKSPNSPLHPSAPGNSIEAFAAESGKVQIVKSVNSAFYGSPDLHSWLQSGGFSEVTIAGLTTNHCCETTARMAANLGYKVNFILDATSTFDMAGPSGRVMSGALLMEATAASLQGEFATVFESTESFISQFDDAREG